MPKRLTRGNPSLSRCVLSENEIRNKNDERTYARLFILPHRLSALSWFENGGVNDDGVYMNKQVDHVGKFNNY